METTIKISSNIKETLDRMRLFERESYNEIIKRMIEDDMELNERAKREIEEREKSPKLISHEDVKKRLGL